MSLLMPEYERHLRAAARRLASDSCEAAKPSRGGLGSWLVLSLVGAVTVAIFVGGVVLIGHRGSPGPNSPAAALPKTQYDCPQHQIVHTKGPLVPTADGTVAGQRWTLDVDRARHGLSSVQAGRLILAGRAYGFCETRPTSTNGKHFRGDMFGALEVELVNAGRHGIVYGLAGRPYHPPIVIQASTKHGTKAHPVRAHNYPATTRQVSGATLFLRALPVSACAYRDLSMSAPERTTTGSTTTSSGITSFGTGEAVIVFVKFTRSCTPGQLRHSS